MDKDGNEYSYFVKYDELGPVIACPEVYMPSLADSAYSPDNLRILKERLGISDRVEQKKCHNGNKVLTKRKD